MATSHCLRAPSSVEKESVLCSVVMEHKIVDGKTLCVKPGLFLHPRSSLYSSPGLFLGPASIRTNTVDQMSKMRI